MDVPAKTAPWRWGDATRWVLYDFAHTSYAMVVLALVFPQMFKETWASGLDPAAESAAYKVTQAIPCLLVFLLAPFLGQLASSARFRLNGLRFAMIGGAAMTAAMAWLPSDGWQAASLLYIGSAACFYIGATFFDSMLVDCAPPERRHMVSGLSFSAGFVAGILILVALGSGLFTDGISPVFVAAAVWWAVFAAPLLLPAAPAPAAPPPRFRDTWAATLATARELWADGRIRWFLLSFVLYIDGVHAVKTTATHFGIVLGYSLDDLIKAFLVAQIVGVPAALAFGWLGQRFGATLLIRLGLVAYLGISLWGAFLLQPGNLELLGLAFPGVWLLAGLVGLVQGGVQALSRSHFASLVPAGRETAYFGFYGMIGRFASFLGPLLGAAVGWVLADPSDPTSAERWGFASFSLLFVAGLLTLRRSRLPGQ